MKLMVDIILCLEDEEFGVANVADSGPVEEITEVVTCEFECHNAGRSKRKLSCSFSEKRDNGCRTACNRFHFWLHSNS